METDGRQENPGALPAGVYGPGGDSQGDCGPPAGRAHGQARRGAQWVCLAFSCSPEIIQGAQYMAFKPGVSGGRAFLLEYFCYAQKLAMVGPAGVPISAKSYVRHPVSGGLYADLSVGGFMKAREGPGPAHRPGENMPLWRENSYWSGLLDRHWQMSLPPAATPPHWRRNAGNPGHLSAAGHGPGHSGHSAPGPGPEQQQMWLTWSAGGSSFFTLAAVRDEEKEQNGRRRNLK